MVSITVELADLADAVGERGARAYLVSVRDERPHVVSVTVEVRGDGVLLVGAGRRTSANVAQRPVVTLLWPTTDAHPKHTLLVDGTAAVTDDGERIAITPTSAILHRAAPGPRC